MKVTYRLFILVILALLPAIAIQAYNEWDLRRSRKAEVHELALRQARLAASEMQRIVDGVRILLTAVAESPSVRAFDGPRCGGFLGSLLRKVPQVATLAVLDLDGRLVCYPTPAPVPVRFNDRPYFQEALARGGFVIGAYTEGRLTKRPTLPMALAVTDAEGRKIAVAAAGLDLTWLNAQMRERALPPGGSLTIADRDGVILAREPLPERFVGTRIPAQFQPLIRAEAPGTIEVLSQDGTRRVLGYVPSSVAPAQSIYVSAGLSSEASFAAVDRATTRGLLLIGAGLLLALTGAALAARRFILRPVARLRAAAERWQAGDYTARAGDVDRGSEFGALGTTFDHMVEEIARREDQLRVSEARLRAVIECLPFDLWVADREDRYVLQNAVSRRNWGLRLGQRPEDTDSPPEVVAFWKDRNARALAGETVRGEAAYTIDGTVRRIEDVLAPIESDGRIVGYVGVNIDVTDRKEAEERQRLLLRELSHRVKNILATVQVIVARSLSSGRSLDEARQLLIERLRALATTHELLTAGGWQGASVRAIAEAELKPYGRRAELEGPDLLLSPRASQTLSLILHELITNAVKHGALSVPEGRVALSWQIVADGAEATFRLDWRETGGPEVTPPARQGFGRDLIERMVAYELKGTAELTFAPTGVAYWLEAPRGSVVA